MTDPSPYRLALEQALDAAETEIRRLRDKLADIQAVLDQK